MSTNKEKFLALVTRQDVDELLEISDLSLRFFLYKIRPENMYSYFVIPKRNGGLRKISAPDNRLKSIQQNLAAILNEVYDPKVCAYGFIPEKSFIDGAKKHSRKNSIFNIDLKDFFTQIHFGRVRGMLAKAPYSIGIEAATVIAQIACLNGSLPQGAPTSPVLTNMICAPLDNNLMKLAKSTKCLYTRYADDITFSTNNKQMDSRITYFKEGSYLIGKELKGTLEKNSFVVNEEKISFRSKYDRQEVTGLTVNLFPNPRRSYIKHLRVLLHKSYTNGLYRTAVDYIRKGYNSKISIAMAIDKKNESTITTWFKEVLIGKILYIKQVKGEDDFTYLSFARKFNDIVENDYFNISRLTSINELISKNVVVINSANKQGSGFLLNGYGLITNFHVIDSEDFFEVSSYSKEIKFQIIKECVTKYDETIDFAQFKSEELLKNGFEIGDSLKLTLGDKVYIGGFPNYIEGDSPNIQSCRITSSRKKVFGASFYTVSGTIFHGFSGGVVLNESFKVVGLIKGGISSMDDNESNSNQGFVPIHLIKEIMDI